MANIGTFALEHYQKDGKNALTEDHFSDSWRYKKLPSSTRADLSDYVIVRTINWRLIDNEKKREKVKRDVDLLRHVHKYCHDLVNDPDPKKILEPGMENVAKVLGINEEPNRTHIVSQSYSLSLKEFVEGSMEGVTPSWKGHPTGATAEVWQFEPMRTALSTLGHQMALGINFMHSLKVISRSIDPWNISVERSSSTDETKHRLMITGFANFRGNVDGSMSAIAAGSDFASKFQAPEFHRFRREGIEDASYDGKAADVFSCACVLFYMATGKAPFSGEQLVGTVQPWTIKEARDKNQHKAITDYYLLRLLKKTLLWDPTKRLSAANLAYHEFFKSLTERMRPNQQQVGNLAQVRVTHEFYGPKTDDGVFEIYPMTRRVRGQALIINNYGFGRFGNLAGSEIDTINLFQLFDELGFEVTVHWDLDKEALERAVWNFSQKKEHEEGQMAVVAVLSHGIEGFIQTYEGPGKEIGLVSKKDVQNVFTSTVCPRLAGKPKLFMFEMCRGHMMATTNAVGKDVPSDAPSYDISSRLKMLERARKLSVPVGPKVPLLPFAGELPPRTREYSDTVTLDSTMEGFVAGITENMGSWFTECVHFVFTNYAWQNCISFSQMDLMRMVTLISGRLRKYLSSAQQVQSNESSQKAMDKILYFNPGIYFETLQDSPYGKKP